MTATPPTTHGHRMGRDAEKTADLFANQVKKGGFTVPADLLDAAVDTYGFFSASSHHADRLQTIKDISDAYGVVVDPHTADGIKAARAAQDAGVETPIICMETALPVKFAETIRDAVGRDPVVPERFAHIMEGGRYVTDMPNDAAAVKDFIMQSINDTEV